jgi:hypothetical protein
MIAVFRILINITYEPGSADPLSLVVDPDPGGYVITVQILPGHFCGH